MKRTFIRVAAPVMLGTSLVVATPTMVSAHANDVKVASVCNKDTGKFDLTWTIANDHPLTETATSRLGSINIAGNGTESQHESVDAGSYTLNVHGVWSDGFEGDASGSVTTSGDCAPPVVIPPKPKDHQKRDVTNLPNCEEHTVTTDHQRRDRTVTYDEESNTWSKGAWGEWITKSSDSRETTSEECPTPPVVGTPGPVTFTDPTCKENIRDFTKPDNGPEFFYFVDADGDTYTITAENTDGKVVQTWTHKYPSLKTDAECAPPVETSTDEAVLPNTGGVSWVLGIIAVGLIGFGILVLSPWKNKVLPKSWNRYN